jgi:hypothetical protein
MTGSTRTIASRKRLISTRIDCDWYAIRVIGTLFTFYKAIVTIGYIKGTLRGYPVREYMDVLRYSDPGEDVYEVNALDFCKVKDRSVIFDSSKMIKSKF